MKKIFIYGVLIISMSVVVYSQVKTGVINSQKIMMNTKKGIQVQKKLENLQKSKMKILEKKRLEIKALEKEISSPALNSNARGKKNRQLQDNKIVLVQRKVEISIFFLS